MEPKHKELAFQKRVCCQYIASSKKNSHHCACGQSRSAHKSLHGDQPEQMLDAASAASSSWNVISHTISSPTDAFGTIDFLDGPHSNKAQYIRLAHDSPCDQILQLLNQGWSIELPKLVISVHGGKANFELNPRVKQVIQTGLLRAAKTTGNDRSIRLNESIESMLRQDK